MQNPLKLSDEDLAVVRRGALMTGGGLCLLVGFWIVGESVQFLLKHWLLTLSVIAALGTTLLIHWGIKRIELMQRRAIERDLELHELRMMREQQGKSANLGHREGYHSDHPLPPKMTEEEIKDAPWHSWM